MSRRASEPTLTVISWRDIPAQVTARSGAGAARRELPPSFHAAIDRAAMKAGLIGTDDYLQEWRRITRSCGDALEDEVAAEVARILTDFPSARLTTLAENRGNEEPVDEERGDEGPRNEEEGP